MICEYCKEVHDGSYGTGRFCNAKCARGFSTKAKRKEINEKVSKTFLLKEYDHPKIATISCEYCKIDFDIIWKRRKQRFCSRICANKSLYKSEEYRNKMSVINKKRCSTLEERRRLRDIGRKGGFGTKGVTQNNTRFESLIEKICFEFLEENKIYFESHKHIPNSSKVSDVYVPNLDLWIEIDGINREKNKHYKFFEKSYKQWSEKLSIYKREKLKYKIVYNLTEFKAIFDN